MINTISTSDVNVKTMQVSINALVIGKKQVTISMFNQFIREEIIGIDGNLKGIPWGYINKDGKHIVWIKNNEIRINPFREYSKIYSTYDFDDNLHDTKEIIECNVKYHTIIQALTYKQDFVEPKHANFIYGLKSIVVKNDKWNVTFEPEEIRGIAEYWYEFLSEDEKIKKDDGTIWTPKKSREEIKENLLKKCIHSASIEECRNMQNLVDEYIENYKKSIKTLTNLEQLFIAV